MYKKIYGTSSAELSTIINVGGIPRRIEFTGGVPSITGICEICNF